MFHCNGWCFPWSVSVVAGTHVCLRQVRAAPIYEALADEGVNLLCGAPIVMSVLLNAGAEEKRDFPQKVRFLTAAAPPPESTLAAMAEQGERLGPLAIERVVTVNGARVMLEGGAWALVRASSNTPNLVVVCESPASAAELRAIFDALDAVIRTEPSVGAYDQTF